MTLFQYCIIAEDVRMEMDGKSTIVGFIGISPHAGIQVPNPNQPIGRVTFAFLTGDTQSPQVGIP
jgi:hypothetical protein